MKPADLAEIIHRLSTESFPEDQGIVANLELLPSCQVTDIMPILMEHLLRKFKTNLKPGRHLAAAGGGSRTDITFNFFILPDDTSSRYHGFRGLVADGQPCVFQYAAFGRDELVDMLGAVLLGEKADGISTVAYCPLPFLQTNTPQRMIHYFDRFPPALLLPEGSSALITAMAERGWNLYPIYADKIYSKDGPAEHLLIGECYSIVPACFDPTSAAQIVAARKHAKETGQTFHVLSCNGPPSGFAPTRLLILREAVVFDPSDRVKRVMEYADFTLCLNEGHWSSYNPGAIPEGQAFN